MLKSLILLFVHLISLCCPVLFQARPIDSLNRTSNNYNYISSLEAGKDPGVGCHMS